MTQEVRKDSIELYEAYKAQLTSMLTDLALAATEQDIPLISTQEEAKKVTQILVELRRLGNEGFAMPFARVIDDPEKPPGVITLMLWGQSDVYSKVSYPRYTLSGFEQLWNNKIKKTQLTRPS